ncbi:MAG TPA: hypothetical protein VIF57_13350 [Polyangia bacterium]
MKIPRLLVVACATLALLVACATGELRGSVDDDDGGDTMSLTDSVDLLPASAGVQLAPPPSGGDVFLDLQFPPSRVATADVFRPPQG